MNKILRKYDKFLYTFKKLIFKQRQNLNEFKSFLRKLRFEKQEYQALNQLKKDCPKIPLRQYRIRK